MEDIGVVTVIENTEKGRNEYGHLWGSNECVLDRNHIDELLDGKAIAINDGEYVTFISIGGIGSE